MAGHREDSRGSSTVRSTPQPAPLSGHQGGPSPVPRDALLWTRSQAQYALELGGSLPEVKLRYQTYGRLNARRDNALLIFHALSGSAHLAGYYPDLVWNGLSPHEQANGRGGWWDALVGPGRLFDTERYYLICANHLGSCYGSTGPLTVNPYRGHPYGPEFPAVTVRDLAQIQARLLTLLGVDRATLIGGSLGGMVALEFALRYPQHSRRLVVLAAPARHGPWARAWNRLAREAIRQDPAYRGGRYQQQPAGMALARAIATLSYRAPTSFEQRWGPQPPAGENYILGQGEKLVVLYKVMLAPAGDPRAGRPRSQAAASLGARASRPPPGLT